VKCDQCGRESECLQSRHYRRPGRHGGSLEYTIQSICLACHQAELDDGSIETPAEGRKESSPWSDNGGSD